MRQKLGAYGSFFDGGIDVPAEHPIELLVTATKEIIW